MDFVRPIEAIVPGVQGRVLSVLAETTTDLNMRTIARLADVSLAQASRVLARLVDHGVVERREVPPSSLFQLVRQHVAVGPLLALARARDALIDEMGRLAAGLSVVPLSAIVFGSFARGEADIDSDIDIVLVRPAGVDESGESWSESVEQWRTSVRQASGNRVEVLEVGSSEVAALLNSRRQVWRDIQSEGLVVHGLSLAELEGESSG
ncbi:MAG: helix-turn-helix domain-containing protein [bacterium]|nr:helix-turn-helix domain-containing protein [bacterium]